MSTESYAEVVSESFNSTPPEEFGDAGATVSELSALRCLFRQQREQAGRKSARDATLRSIQKGGYPLPDEVTPEIVAVAGAKHACGVTEHLARERGPEAAEATYESYTTKNRFDRFVYLHLPETLRESWRAPIYRQSGHENPAVSYPKGVKDRYVHSAAKPSHILPAQTIRYLESARLGRLDKDTQEAMSLTGVSPEKLTIVWDEFIPFIESASDTVQLTGAIGANIAHQLLRNGLPPEKVAAVLRRGFSTEGIKWEHGDIDESAEVATTLINQLLRSPETEELLRLI